MRRKKKLRVEIFGGGIIGGEDDDEDQMVDLRLSEIVVATNDFSDENKLGEGGFGSVYKVKKLLFYFYSIYDFKVLYQI